jgi:hypothetical protein
MAHHVDFGNELVAFFKGFRTLSVESRLEALQKLQDKLNLTAGALKLDASDFQT